MRSGPTMEALGILASLATIGVENGSVRDLKLLLLSVYDLNDLDLPNVVR